MDKQLIRALLFLGCASLAAQMPILPGVLLPTSASAVLQTPGFVSESGKNSTLAIALSTSGGAGEIAAATCASYSYCLPYAETSLTGNLGIVVYQYANGGTPVSATATDDQSDSYTCANPSSTDTSKLLGLCYSANLTAGAHKSSVTFGTTGVTQVQADAAMFYNIATSTPLDGTVTAVAGSSSTTMTGPTLSTTAKDIVYAFFCRTGTPLMTSGSFTAGSGFTLGLTKYQDGCASEWEVSAGGNITPTMTMGSASTYLVIAAAFKASSSPAGTQPTKPYLQRVMSWSSASSVSASTTKFQFPSGANDLLVSTEVGAVNYAANTITDSGANSWTLAGQCLQSGACVNSGGYSSEFYVNNAAANTTNTQVVNFTGTGDATVFFYDFAGMPASSFTNRGEFGSNSSTNTLLPASAFSFLPWATSPLTVSAGPIAFNTAVSVSSPSSCLFDAGYFGGMSVNGGATPESVIDQNNIWSHCYQTGIAASQSWQWGVSVAKSEANNVGADLVSFVAPGGIGIVGTATSECTSSCTTFQTFTVPSTTAGDLLVVSTGWYDGSTIQTVSKVCTGNSSTCGSGSQFVVATGAASTQTSTIFGNAIWYLASAPAGATQITVVYSGTTSAGGNEHAYWEVSSGSGNAWVLDPVGGGGHVNAGSTSSGTSSGATVTTLGTNDFCVGHIDVSGTGVTANPKSGNSFIYAVEPTASTAFASGGAANALLTVTATGQQPVWTTSAGTFNEATACFKE